MKTRTIYLTLAAFALSVSAGAPRAHAADSVVSVRKSLQTIYNKSSIALKQKDADGACDMYDPDCTIYTSTGETADVNSMRDALGQVLGIFQKMSDSTLIKSCTIANTDGTESAKVTILDVKNAVIFTPKGKRLLLKDIIARRDYWEKTDDGWKIKQSRVLSDNGYINGKHLDSVDPSDIQEEYGN